MTNEYPEVKPVDQHAAPDKFLFNIRNVRESKHDIERVVAEIEHKIEALIDDTEIEGHSILIPILKLSEDASDLTKLGNALLAAAPLMDELKTYRGQLSVLETAETNPGFLFWAFADFSDDFDNVDNLFGDKPKGPALPLAPRTFKEL